MYLSVKKPYCSLLNSIGTSGFASKKKLPACSCSTKLDLQSLRAFTKLNQTMNKLLTLARMFQKLCSTMGLSWFLFCKRGKLDLESLKMPWEFMIEGKLRTVWLSLRNLLLMKSPPLCNSILCSLYLVKIMKLVKFSKQILDLLI